MTINERILSIATGYIGKNEEPGNSGWYDEDFERKMRERGWHPSEAWCSYFAELCWFEAYINHPVIQLDMNKLFSGSAVQTFRNFKREADWIVDRIPEPGALAVFQRYKNWQPHCSGHMAITNKDQNNVLCTIDGNSNPTGGREGYTVTPAQRVINFEPIANGLVLLGFVHPQ